MTSLPNASFCPGCKRVFQNALLLPCGHSLCAKCFEKPDGDCCAVNSCGKRVAYRNQAVENKTLNELVFRCFRCGVWASQKTRSRKKKKATIACTSCKNDFDIVLKITVKEKTVEKVVPTAPSEPLQAEQLKRTVPQFLQPPINPAFITPPSLTPPPSPPRPTPKPFDQDSSIRQKKLTDVPGIGANEVAAFERKSIRNAKMLLGYYLDCMNQNKGNFLRSLKEDFGLPEERARSCCEAISAFSHRFVAY